MGRPTKYHKNRSQSYEYVCQENKQLVEDFNKYCKANNRSPQTIKAYMSALKIFFSWNYENNNDKFFIDLKKRDFIYYIGSLQELELSSNRIAFCKTVLSSFSNAIEILYEEEYPNFKNKVKALEPIKKVPVLEKLVYTYSQVQEMLQQLIEAKKYQAACYLALACASGARKAELLQMKTDWFNEEHEIFDGYMYKTGSVRSKGHGVQGKIIQKYVIKDFFKPYFDLWMKERERKGIDSEYLFITNRGKPYNPEEGVFFPDTISKVCNINFYIHSARHFFCTYLRTLNFPDEIIRAIFSWEDAAMVKVYNDASDEDTLKHFFENLELE